MQRPEYQDLVARGVAPRLAEMLSMGCAPTVRTGNEFFRGKANGRQFANDPHVGDMYAAEARRAGVSTAGKYYSHQLAEYPGDPKAWVSDASEFSDRVRQRGDGCGPLGIKAKPSSPPPADIPIAEDIVAEEVVARCDEDPGLKAKVKGNPKKLAELREQVIDEHKPHWVK